MNELFRKTKLTPGLWSAGYEGRDIDSFVASLLDSRIDVVADARQPTPCHGRPTVESSTAPRW